MDVIKVAAASETDLIINRNFIKRLSPQNGGSCVLYQNDVIASQKFYTDDYSTNNENDYVIQYEENQTTQSINRYNQKYCLSNCILNKIVNTFGCITEISHDIFEGEFY